MAPARLATSSGVRKRISRLGSAGSFTPAQGDRPMSRASTAAFMILDRTWPIFRTVAGERRPAATRSEMSPRTSACVIEASCIGPNRGSRWAPDNAEVALTGRVADVERRRRPLVDPLGERDPPERGVEPVASGLVDRHAGEKPFGVGFAVEGFRT